MTLEDRFFETVDTEGKAYLLGWIASDGAVRESTISIVVHDRDRVVLEQLKRIICPELPTLRKTDTQSGIAIHSQGIVRDVCNLLGIEPGAKSRRVKLPELQSDDLKWAFIRGFFDGDGSIRSPRARHSPQCSITTGSVYMRQGIIDFCGIKCYHDPREGKVEWYGNNALDLLGKLYDGARYYLPRKRDRYLNWGMWVPSLSGRGAYGRQLHFRWTKTDEQAVAPAKGRVSDSGYDLTLIRKAKVFGRTELYDTGIKVQPAYGWYFDLVPRSSIIKSGYLLANSIGVIDRTYTGPILVPLIKVDPDAADLELPARIVQLIPRPIIHVQFLYVDELDETNRGEGGFGSTGR